MAATWFFQSELMCRVISSMRRATTSGPQSYTAAGTPVTAPVPAPPPADVPATPAVWPFKSYVRMLARLSYANDGGGATYEIDVRRGVVATVQPCQSLSVEIEYQKAPNELLAPAEKAWVDGPPLRVSVSAVYGHAPMQKVPRSDFLGLVSAALAPIYTPRRRIPAFADRATIITGDTATRPAGGVWLVMYGDNSTGPALVAYDLAERDEGLVPQGAEFYSVYLSSGVQYITTSWLVVA